MVVVVVTMVGESAGGVVAEVEATGASALASSSVSGGVGIPSALLSDRERCIIIAFGGITCASVAISLSNYSVFFVGVLRVNWSSQNREKERCGWAAVMETIYRYICQAKKARQNLREKNDVNVGQRRQGAAWTSEAMRKRRDREKPLIWPGTTSKQVIMHPLLRCKFTPSCSASTRLVDLWVFGPLCLQCYPEQYWDKSQ